jgi:hypothetical protein
MEYQQRFASMAPYRDSVWRVLVGEFFHNTPIRALQGKDGAHRFSCVVRNFGEEKVIASRTIRTRNTRANLAEAPNTSKAIR